MNQKVLQGQKTREKILQTAASMFHRRNYHGVKIDEIIEEAGVNKGSFYHYFKTKEISAIESIKYMKEKTKELVYDATFLKTNDPVERLEGIFKLLQTAYKKQIKEHGRILGCPFMNIGSELATENDAIRDEVAQAWEEFYSYYEQIYNDSLKKGLTNKKITKTKVGPSLLSILNGAITNAKISNKPDALKDGLEIAKGFLGV